MSLVVPDSPDKRRLISAHSPAFFDIFYCGMRYANHRVRWLEAFDRVADQAKAQGDKGRLLVLAPRDHGKTELGITYALRAVCMDRNIRILWISASAAQAERRMRRLKSLLRSERIMEDWASEPEIGCTAFEGGDAQWTTTQVYVQRDKHSIDPTIQAIGSGGAITGAHFDLIIADDIEDDRTVYTSAGREKTRSWFKGTCQPMLVRGGLLVVIGTRKHADDLFGHLKDDPVFSVIEEPAIKRWPEKYAYKIEVMDGRDVISGVDVEGEHEVLWPEERPLEYLLRERRSMGAQLFAREFQNEVVDDSAAAFKWSWLEAAQERGKHLSLYEFPKDVSSLDIVQGWDFALVTNAAAAEARDRDWSVGTTWGRDPDTGIHYLLGIKRVRGVSIARLQGYVVAEYERFKGTVNSVAVEKNAFGEIHYTDLVSKTDLPIKAHLTTKQNKSDPWQGVPSLSILFENGKVVIPSATEEDKEMTAPLMQELFGLGREKHDDCVMSLWIAHSVLREQRFSHTMHIGDVELDYRGNPIAFETEEDVIARSIWDDLPITLN